MADDLIPLRTATGVWFRVSLQTFGGPAGQIAVMHRMLVDELRWFGERRFLHALNYCMLLPGPEAQQLAIYLGWLLNGARGGLIAGSLFVLPGFVALMVLSVIYAAFGDALVVDALFAGIAPAVIAIVAAAMVRIADRALTNSVLVGFAVGAFVALSLFDVPFPLVVATALAVGLVAGRRYRDRFVAPAREAVEGETPPLLADDALHRATRTPARSVSIVAIAAAVWALPLLAAAILFGRDSVYFEAGTFFSGAAVVTFGGAYAVLGYIAERAIYTYHWLLPGEMVRGLAMAETTPGPLIQVVQFVGFMAAYRNPGSLNPWVGAVLAACIVTWVTYVPCFLWILLGAPYVESLRQSLRLSAALGAVTAAVVGVIGNLAIFFAVHTLFSDVDDNRRIGLLQVDVPALASISPRAVVVTSLALFVVFKLRWSVLRTLGVCALVGGGLHVIATL